MACMLYVVCKYIQHTRAGDFFRLRSNAEPAMAIPALSVVVFAFIEDH